MAPTPQKLHFDKALTEISVAYKNEQFVIDQIAKPLTVQKQSDRYFIYGEHTLVPVEDYRAPGTLAKEITWDFSWDTFFTEEHALAELIPDESFANNDSGFDLEVEAAENVMGRLLLNKEIKGASILLDPTKYDADLVIEPTLTWESDTSNPVKDVEDAKNAMHLKSGFAPNTFLLSRPVYNRLRLHPTLLAYFKVTEIATVTLEMLKRFFDIENIIIASAMKKGATRSYIWGENAILAYVPPKPARKTPALAYQFNWDQGQGTTQSFRFRKEEERALKIESQINYDFKIISNVGGCIFPSILG